MLNLFLENIILIIIGIKILKYMFVKHQSQSIIKVVHKHSNKVIKTQKLYWIITEFKKKLYAIKKQKVVAGQKF